MGLLLMQYEYQKAKMKSNLLQLQGIRLSDKHEMYTKRISNIEKMFAKKKTSLESRYTNYNNQINSIMNTARAAADKTSFSSKINDLSSVAILSGAKIAISDSDFNIKAEDTTSTEYKQQLASNMSAIASQIQSYISTLVEAMKQAELDELEMIEDQQREPIAEKDAEIQADIAANETLSTLAKEREEAAKAKLPEVVKGSVAHYGLS